MSQSLLAELQGCPDLLTAAVLVNRAVMDSLNPQSRWAQLIIDNGDAVPTTAIVVRTQNKPATTAEAA